MKTKLKQLLENIKISNAIKDYKLSSLGFKLGFLAGLDQTTVEMVF